MLALGTRTMVDRLALRTSVDADLELEAHSFFVEKMQKLCWAELGLFGSGRVVALS
jgi:hypothetical protein